MAKYTKKELRYLLEFDSKYQQKVGIPNDIFEILSQDEELNVAKAPHVAYAYAYVFITAWFYKYAKYNLPFEVTDVSSIKEIIGLSPIEKRYNYIFKKGGVLDRLGITKTVNFKEASYEYVWENGDFWGFVKYEEWLAKRDSRDIDEMKAVGVNLNTKRKQIKYPIFGLDKRIVNEEEIEGTFYEWGNSHAVPMDVFIECMTNDNLGATAFYIYAYLNSRCGMNDGSIEVSLDRMKSVTGIRHTTINTALNNLKAYNLIICYPATFVVNKGNIETGASVYQVVEEEYLFNQTPTDFQKRDVIYIEQYEKKLALMKEIENTPLWIQ
ncbi:hypothetical protein HMPREF1210_00142 [Paenisporosarcina sp. HGH0030]|uniref:hypothetical protein n=1 Tax=Paenisporosarcina sp. HGH0030 TaxID=1078085 RepID=UPI00034E5F59|nr:hypothetical protein [Paenisporosarcina sp. HGH0030]EPD54157.1 hypothetical protein HMPREF1210_00142 [Paenisporosarcina sp. HGH0030]